jgi:hypothetical protein
MNKSSWNSTVYRRIGQDGCEEYVRKVKLGVSDGDQ